MKNEKGFTKTKTRKFCSSSSEISGNILGKFIKWGAPLPKIRFSATEKAVFKILPKNQTENQTGVPGSKKNWAALR